MLSEFRRTLARTAPSARLVDWTLFVLVAFQVVSGLLSFTVGRPTGAFVFWAHSIAGVTLAFFLLVKLWRVRRRVTDSRLRTSATWLSLALALVAVGALATGVFWVFGGDFQFSHWGALSVHVFFGLLLIPLLSVHLWTRRDLPGLRRPRRSDVEGRRDALRYASVLVVGALVWRGQRVVNRVFDTDGATRRFTGSKPADGPSFPVTSWVADDPDPVDPETWRLRVGGLVAEELELALAELGAETTDRALLDCTSGWYTVQDWRGVRVGDLLDRAGLDDESRPSVAAGADRDGGGDDGDGDGGNSDGDGRWVRFTSVTGYRWSLPLAEAEDALLATHVAGERLSHGHGAPLRLVAPGRRGFQWVKWVESVEVRETRDFGQWVAILISGFD